MFTYLLGFFFFITNISITIIYDNPLNGKVLSFFSYTQGAFVGFTIFSTVSIFLWREKSPLCKLATLFTSGISLFMIIGLTRETHYLDGQLLTEHFFNGLFLMCLLMIIDSTCLKKYSFF